jgi:hypothetical protein
MLKNSLKLSKIDYKPESKLFSIQPALYILLVKIIGLVNVHILSAKTL